MYARQIQRIPQRREGAENRLNKIIPLRLSVSAVKSSGLNGDGEFSVLDIDLSREIDEKL